MLTARTSTWFSRVTVFIWIVRTFAVSPINSQTRGFLTGCAGDERQRNISQPLSHFPFLCRPLSLFVLMSLPPPDPYVSDRRVSSSLSFLTGVRQRASKGDAQLCLSLFWLFLSAVLLSSGSGNRLRPHDMILSQCLSHNTTLSWVFPFLFWNN